MLTFNPVDERLLGLSDSSTVYLCVNNWRTLDLWRDYMQRACWFGSDCEPDRLFAWGEADAARNEAEIEQKMFRAFGMVRR